MHYTFEKSFGGLDFLKKPLKKGDYECCRFENCTFSDTDLSEFRFLETEFIACNLSNTSIHKTSFQEIRFRHCKMLGLQFDTCNDFAFAIAFEDCQLDHSTFYQMKLNRISFKDCHLKGVDFTEATIKNIRFQNCDLLNAVFSNTNLENADLSTARNYAIDPELNWLKGAKFSIPEVFRLLEKYKIEIVQ